MKRFLSSLLCLFILATLCFGIVACTDDHSINNAPGTGDEEGDLPSAPGDGENNTPSNPDTESQYIINANLDKMYADLDDAKSLSIVVRGAEAQSQNKSAAIAFNKEADFYIYDITQGVPENFNSTCLCTTITLKVI